jgi:hypothetical protein
MMSGSIARAASSKGMVPPLRSEFLLQIVGELDDPQQIGKTPAGMRRILYMKGGSFAGPKLEGLVLPGGGDWVLGREDGVAQLDIRMTLRTVENELIYVSCNGLLDMAPELRARLMQGESVDREEYYFRTSLVFETAAKNYGWLNRLVAVGVGTRTPEGMMTDVFAIR